MTVSAQVRFSVRFRGYGHGGMSTTDVEGHSAMLSCATKITYINALLTLTIIPTLSVSLIFSVNLTAVRILSTSTTNLKTQILYPTLIQSLTQGPNPDSKPNSRCEKSTT